MSEEPLKKSITALTKSKNSDILLFNGEINDANADQFIQLIRNECPTRKGCILILTTNGGDPDAGYRMVRKIKKCYESFTLYIFGSCKSTGTLMALGADEIVMTDFGEFGPLDIQLTRDDELSFSSGLNYVQSLLSLNEQMYRSFEESFLSIKNRSGGTITTRTAAEISSKLAIGLVSPISAQIDPIKLGEVQRAIKITDAYGRRLCENPSLVAKLIAGYPSHGFVIDSEEAKSIFRNVRDAEDDENELERLLLPLARKQAASVLINNLTRNYFVEDVVDTGKNDNLPPKLEKAEAATKEENANEQLNNKLEEAGATKSGAKVSNRSKQNGST